MARSYNRKYRRKNGMKPRLTVREEQEMKNFVLIIFIVAVLFGLMYLLTYVILEQGFISKGYQKPTISDPIVDYETATIGTVFGKPEKEYYVVFDEFGDIHKKSVYLDSILQMYKDEKDKLPVYKVDMSYGVTDQYKSEKSNPKANKSSDLKINGVTLIKIKNGKNVLYLDNIDKIAKEFGFSAE